MVQGALFRVTTNELHVHVHVERLKQTSTQYLKVRLCSENRIAELQLALRS